jgi:hypothetical protein
LAKLKEAEDTKKRVKEGMAELYYWKDELKNARTADEKFAAEAGYQLSWANIADLNEKIEEPLDLERFKRPGRYNPLPPEECKDFKITGFDKIDKQTQNLPRIRSKKKR